MRGPDRRGLVGADAPPRPRRFPDAPPRLLDRGIRLTKVRRLLRRDGVSVPDATLWRFASAELGFGQTPGTIPVADCGPGEELQGDGPVSPSRSAPRAGDRG